MKDLVHCRADHAYPGRPLEMWHEGRWRQVSTIIDEKVTPTGRYYRVVSEEQEEFILSYDPGSDSWQVIAL